MLFQFQYQHIQLKELKAVTLGCKKIGAKGIRKCLFCNKPYKLFDYLICVHIPLIKYREKYKMGSSVKWVRIPTLTSPPGKTQ